MSKIDYDKPMPNKKEMFKDVSFADSFEKVRVESSNYVRRKGKNMRNSKEEKFRFTGAGSSWLNDDLSLGLAKDTCDEVGVKLAQGTDGFGCKENLIVRKSAKRKANGKFEEKDVIARFKDGDRCNLFLNGMCALARLRKKKGCLLPKVK